MKARDRRPQRSASGRARTRSRAALLAALALAAQAGCGREFFREWANQDVSEAIFEKSRDPRWRLDLFSVEPPALARFSDPYDPDRPPAPPDDYAAEQMSPTPQWPDNRLIVPAEGTGYIDMLEAWQRNRPAPRPTGPTRLPFQIERDRAAGAPASATPPTPPAAGTPSPFSPPPGNPSVDTLLEENAELMNPPAGNPSAPAGDVPAAPQPNPPRGGPAASPSNSGPGGAAMSPTSLLPTTGTGAASPAPATASPAPGANLPAESPQAGTPKRGRDSAVMLSAFQEAGLPLPSSTPGTTAPPTRPTPPPDGLDTPPIGMDPDPSNRNLSQPENPRPDLSPDQYRASEAVASELAGILVPGAIDFNDAEAAGLPRGGLHYVLTMEQAFTLALINSRAYQFNLENVYLNALAVTQQRFAFTPQVFAGLSPGTALQTGGVGGVGAGFTPNPVNQFIYATAETGSQLSALNLGAVAGFGKVFQSGARLLAGFANQVIFNFTGQNPGQPTVRSFLPLTLVQPFLRGGGRAVTLEALTQAERSLLYSVRSFAKFRQEFVVSLLVGGSPVTNLGAAVQTPGFSGGGNTDPSIGFINLLEDMQLVENNRRNIAAYEKIRSVYEELIKGESSGLTKLQLDQVDSSLQNARQQLVQSRTTLRSDLDQFKQQMGLPPDTPIVPDRGLTRRFKEVYDGIDEWQRDPRRDLADLPQFAESLPQLQDVIIDGRSVLGVYNTNADNEDKLEDLLLAAERVALEHRLDLMNARAQLYDSWRQIKVNANALQGVFNVALTNTLLTPQTTNNPFAFVDQAKQFSVVINAELPLIRMTERNNFRSALIGYQRQRRSLQSTEDTIKYTVRQDIRLMHQNYLQYQIQKRNLVLLISQKDQAFEQIIAPPQGATGSSQGAVQTNNLTSAQTQLVNAENGLIQTWYNYQTQRLALYRDLGILPYDEWEAFHELFPDEPLSPGADAAARGAGSARAAAARPESNPPGADGP
ncbi:MAG: hypothetical protein U0794_15190 [Isosphaeraceae bacterium]